jgi:CHASE3 domain sensor protein
VTLAEVIDDHFLRRYRELLDAEDAAFDELEHAYEDGDREHFEVDLEAWKRAINRKLEYLQRCGVQVSVSVTV